MSPNLTPIIYSADDPRNGGVAETIREDAAPSLNAAFAQIHAESGIKPIVLRDYGGARTEAQQAHLVSIGESDTMNSDHREDALPGHAAADIDNQVKLRAWNEGRFVQIMADHGWHNMTNTGAPFPKEPWHFATHNPITTASTNVHPLLKGLPDMELVRNISDATAAPKYHGDVVLFDTHRIIRKMGAPAVYQPAADRFGIQDTASDAQFLGRLNGFGWTAAEYDQVRALGKSNAIGERLGDGSFRVYVANDVA